MTPRRPPTRGGRRRHSAPLTAADKWFRAAIVGAVLVMLGTVLVVLPADWFGPRVVSTSLIPEPIPLGLPPSGQQQDERPVEIERAVPTEQQLSTAPRVDCDPDAEQLVPHAQYVACFLGRRFGTPLVLGSGPGTVDGDEYPAERAVGVVVGPNLVLGDEIAACAAANFTEWGLAAVIFHQTRLHKAGGKWRSMPDRGSDTANHRDHVLLVFSSTVPERRSLSCPSVQAK